jgi:nucleoside-diphosphate-sugar epimerase
VLQYQSSSATNITLIFCTLSGNTTASVMSSEKYPLRRSGIYRNLPTFDPSITDLNAIVVGATGISGFNTIRSLLDSPHRWSTIYALSRSPIPEEMLAVLTDEQKYRIKHVSIDLTASGEKLASQLKDGDVEAEYVFFYGYISPKSVSDMDPKAEEELVKANKPILENFLAALEIANLEPKRILLQTGGKNYGGQIGRARLPYIESDPQPRHLSQNFYYPQEDMLKAYCEKHPKTGWNVIRPFGVIGAVSKAGMNTFIPFAVMAAVQAEKNEPLFFGGDIDEWQYELLHSSAPLTGFLSEWAVLEEHCKNQDFNAHDGSPVSWDRFFEELARWYGAPGIEGPELDDSKFNDVVLKGGKEAPLGYGPPTKIRISRSLMEWSKEASNLETWKKMMDNSNGKLKVDVFEEGGMGNFDMADFVYYKIGQPSSAKFRRFGFSGFVDTMESVFEMYQDLAKMGVIPAPKVEAARPMI